MPEELSFQLKIITRNVPFQCEAWDEVADFFYGQSHVEL